MKKIKAVGFDFDNTLIMSEKEKLNLIEEIFASKYNIKKGVKLAYKNLMGKANNEEKLRMLIRKFLKREPSEREIRELHYTFKKGYEYKLSSCPLVLCINILKELQDQVDFMFLLSLEDKDIVKDVARHCGIAKYFDEILGGPKSKVENFKYIIENKKIKPDEIIYIGDSKEDIIKSKMLKIKAFGIQQNSYQREILKRLGADFTFSNFCQLPLRKIIS